MRGEGSLLLPRRRRRKLLKNLLVSNKIIRRLPKKILNSKLQSKILQKPNPRARRNQRSKLVRQKNRQRQNHRKKQSKSPRRPGETLSRRISIVRHLPSQGL